MVNLNDNNDYVLAIIAFIAKHCLPILTSFMAYYLH